MALSTIQNNSFADTAVHGFRNLVTNGACTISQRGTSVTGTSSAFLVDRWKVQTDTAATYEQVSDAPTGFTNSLKFTNTTASSSSTSYREIRYIVEAQDLANSGWNYTSSSAYMSFSFWVKSSVAQTMSVLFRVDDTATNKYFSRQFTINSANTWEYKTMTIFGDSGLTVNNDNGAGLSIFISPFYGTNYASASSDGVWASATSNAIITFDSTWASTTNSTIQITGVQLELGSEATPFEHRPYADELVRCQRYYQVLLNNNVVTNGYQWQGQVFSSYNTTRAIGAYRLPVIMRATPTGINNSISVSIYGNNTNYGPSTTIANTYGSISSWGMDITPATNLSQGSSLHIDVIAGSYHLDAEL